ncbi:MAG: energy-coupling factor ABC transporter permease [Candidatus Aminicenantales bacterium]
MHIPDGFLDAKTIGAASVLSAAGVAAALRHIKSSLTSRKVPLMGLAAAFLFVAQMINFPVIGGTSGHLLGGVLAAVLLGPNEAVLVMVVVISAQCLLFADGGLLSLGANVLNMGLVAPLGGYALFRLAAARLWSPAGRFAAASLAAWFSVVLASVFCAGELAWSGTVPWSLGFPAMAGIHILIGAGEAVITTLVLTAIVKARPELLPAFQGPGTPPLKKPSANVLVLGSLMVLGLIVFVLPFASPWPDGLEKAASTLGFESRALSKPVLSSPLADYRVPGIGSLPLATALAAAVGAILVFSGCFFLAKKLFPGPKNKEPGNL